MNENPFKFKLLNNNVLIRLVPMNDTIELEGGQKLYLDTSFEPQDHVSVCGTIVKLPEKLNYRKGTIGGMRWKTKIEAEVGDLAYFDYHSALMALGRHAGESIQYADENWWIYHGDTYILINYADIFAVSRVIHDLQHVYPINGYAIIQPDKEEINSNLEIPYHLRVKASQTRGKILYLGTPNEEYQDKRKHDAIDVKEGDTVVFKPAYVRRIEYDLHATLPKGVIVIQRNQILAKYV